MDDNIFSRLVALFVPARPTKTAKRRIATAIRHRQLQEVAAEICTPDWLEEYERLTTTWLAGGSNIPRLEYLERAEEELCWRTGCTAPTAAGNIGKIVRLSRMGRPK